MGVTSRGFLLFGGFINFPQETQTISQEVGAPLLFMRMLLASITAGLGSGLGALPLLLVGEIPDVLKYVLRGFAAGVMVSAASFSLVLNSLESGGVPITILGILAGGLVVFLPGVLPRGRLKIGSSLLLLFAVILHNIPEGFTIGIGFAARKPGLGPVLATAIGIQNAPEGLLIAAPLKERGVSSLRAVGAALLAGLVEPAAAVVGYLLLGTVHQVIPFFLAFAGGAMFYVVYEDLIPKSHGHGYDTVATVSFFFGLVLMLSLKELVG